jgi:hypothetical protein
MVGGQGLPICRLDAAAQPTSECVDLTGAPLKALAEIAPTARHLSRVDAFADTVFTVEELPRLVGEVRAVIREASDESVRAALERVSAFISRSVELGVEVMFVDD